MTAFVIAAPFAMDSTAQGDALERVRPESISGESASTATSSDKQRRNARQHLARMTVIFLSDDIIDRYTHNFGTKLLCNAIVCVTKAKFSNGYEVISSSNN